MTTFIISAVIVGLFSAAVKALNGLNREARRQEQRRKERKEALRKHLPHILALESMGLKATVSDAETLRTLQDARRNRFLYALDGVEPCTIAETVQACYSDPETLKSALRVIRGIKADCNVTFSPDLQEAVKRYATAEKKRLEEERNKESQERTLTYKAEGLRRKEAVNVPYYVSDQLEALDDIIGGLYARIALLEEERSITFNDIRKLEIDEKIAKLRLSAAKKEQEADRLRSKYMIK